MLADRFVEYMTGLKEAMRRAAEPPPPTSVAWEGVNEPITFVRQAARFRLDDKAYGLVASAMDRGDALQASCPYLAWPAPQTWVEFTADGMAIGLLFVTDDEEPDQQIGNVFLIAWPARVPHPIQLHGVCYLDQAEPFQLNKADTALQLINMIERRNGLPAGAQTTMEGYRKLVDTTTRTIAGTLALLNSPKTVRVVEEVDFARLNKRRKQMKRPPLLSHRVVTVDLAKVERTLREGDEREGEGGHVQQHFVRWHLRLVRGVLYPVRPHWRGDPSLGTKPPAYRLTASPGPEGAG
jgi:hypothetical protein